MKEHFPEKYAFVQERLLKIEQAVDAAMVNIRAAF
jgi:hypothetical protein